MVSPHGRDLSGPLPDVLRSPKEAVESIRTPAGDRMWMVRDYTLARQVLSDPRFSRSEATTADAPRFAEVQPIPQSMMSMDGYDHARLRRIVAGAFSAQRIAATEPTVARLADEHLDRLAAAGPPADLIAGLAAPLPIAVLCGLLGIPIADAEVFGDSVEVLFDITSGPAEMSRRRLELVRYMADLMARKAGSGDDDLLGMLIAARDRDGMTKQEMLAMALALLMAGYETTIGQIGMSVLTLLTRPDAHRALLDDPDSLPAVVEELLRLDSASPLSFPRVATEAVRLGDVDIRAGEAVIVSLMHGNRDEQVFAEPDLLLANGRGPTHLAFGHGIHRCLGAPLARLQLHVVLGRLLTRFPDLRLADGPDAVRWKDGLATRGLARLMVAWQPVDPSPGEAPRAPLPAQARAR